MYVSEHTYNIYIYNTYVTETSEASHVTQCLWEGAMRRGLMCKQRTTFTQTLVTENKHACVYSAVNKLISSD